MGDVTVLGRVVRPAGSASVVDVAQLTNSGVDIGAMYLTGNPASEELQQQLMAMPIALVFFGGLGLWLFSLISLKLWPKRFFFFR